MSSLAVTSSSHPQSLYICKEDPLGWQGSTAHAHFSINHKRLRTHYPIIQISQTLGNHTAHLQIPKAVESYLSTLLTHAHFSVNHMRLRTHTSHYSVITNAWQKFTPNSQSKRPIAPWTMSGKAAQIDNKHKKYPIDKSSLLVRLNPSRYAQGSRTIYVYRLHARWGGLCWAHSFSGPTLSPSKPVEIELLQWNPNSSCSKDISCPGIKLKDAPSNL